jgi:hypothetical protein
MLEKVMRRMKKVTSSETMSENVTIQSGIRGPSSST